MGIDKALNGPGSGPDGFIELLGWPVALPSIVIEAIPEMLDARHARKMEIETMRHQHQMEHLGAVHLLTGEIDEN